MPLPRGGDAKQRKFLGIAVALLFLFVIVFRNFVQEEAGVVYKGTSDFLQANRRVKTLEAQLEHANQDILSLAEVVETLSEKVAELGGGSRTVRDLRLDDEFNVRLPRTRYGKVMPLEDRVRLLELKMGAALTWQKDPISGVRQHPELCTYKTKMQEFGCIPGDANYDPNKLTPEEIEHNCEGYYDHSVCLDDFPKKEREDNNKCLVYDFGIREQPEFGRAFVLGFDCEVHGFDPSEVSRTFMMGDDSPVKDLENYHFHPYGAGGQDGVVQLFPYDWEQVSMLMLRMKWFNCTEGASTNIGECDYGTYDNHATFDLPVRTMRTIMQELGHTYIDVLKIDVEGSEYMFLQDMLDWGCPDYVGQITLEWHHQDIDSRYGEGTHPQINAITNILEICGFRAFDGHSIEGWQTITSSIRDRAPSSVRYNIMSYMRMPNSLP